MFKTVSGLFTFINKLFLSFSDEDDDIYECKADGEKFKTLGGTFHWFDDCQF